MLFNKIISKIRGFVKFDKSNSLSNIFVYSQAILDSTNDMLVYVDNQYVLRAINSSALHFRGRELDEFVGHKVTEILEKDEYIRHCKPYIDKCLHGEFVTSRDWIKDFNTKSVYIESCYHPHRDNQQNIIGVIITSRDLTVHKQIENNFRLQLEAMDIIPEGIFIAEKVSRDAPILYINKGFLNLTGYNKEEVLTRDCRFLQGPGTDKETVREMRDCLENDKMFSGEILNYKKDGTPFWTLLRI